MGDGYSVIEYGINHTWAHMLHSWVDCSLLGISFTKLQWSNRTCDPTFCICPNQKKKKMK